MTDPLTGVDRLPGWQQTLLQQVQDLTYEHSWMLKYEFPTYFPGSEAGHLPVDIWRAQLRNLHSQRIRAWVRALHAGLPRATVDAVAEAGADGTRWGDSPYAPQQAMLGILDIRVECLAFDAYRLEQMAAMQARRVAMQGVLRPDSAEIGLPEQTRRNMVATAHRAAVYAQILDLSEVEAAAFWDRDTSAWDGVIDSLMEYVDDFAVVEEWRAASWGHIETAVIADIQTLTNTHGLTSAPRWWPPDPDTLVARAGAAVARYHERISTGAAVEHGSAPEAATAVDADPGLEAESDSATLPADHFDPDLGW
ncbi:hypothetical protein [Nocardia cyriacigeorgica]|uniref:hypothetical protein n=1 Tax=Nocardia cyriacigeorgica TaxID=135487 RepID=UPI0024556D6C|nr:hypothetical protein [Nocardia cyriacigeorgica]